MFGNEITHHRANFTAGRHFSPQHNGVVPKTLELVQPAHNKYILDASSLRREQATSGGGLHLGRLGLLGRGFSMLIEPGNFSLAARGEELGSSFS